MGYYRGDYYRGDYYRGSIFSSIGNVVKKVAGAVFKATPVGSALNSLVSSSAPSIPRLSAPMATQAPSQYGLINISRPVPNPLGFGGGGRVRGGSSSTAPGLRKRRRIDYGNMKALRRADRRARGFLHAYSRAVSHFVPHAKKGKAYVHFKKKSR